MRTVLIEPTFEGWREQARWLLCQRVPPQEMLWSCGGAYGVESVVVVPVSVAIAVTVMMPMRRNAARSCPYRQRTNRFAVVSYASRRFVERLTQIPRHQEL